VPFGIIGSDVAMPQDRKVIRRAPITLRIGRPIDLSRYFDRRTDPLVLRSATDEIMYEIMLLSGQEYVDEYASHVKSGAVDLGEDLPLPPLSDRTLEDGADDDDEGAPGASAV
jgi:1-acyl-sn-glycerol-3-phosphate acyltransferase